MESSFCFENEQTDWVDAVRSTDFLDSDLLANLENVIMPQTSVSTFPELSFGNEAKGEDYSDDEDDVNTQNKRKRRQEIKNQSETKRRMKLNEQLLVLQSMLLSESDLQCESTKKKSKKSKATREIILDSAIQEISKLRQELHQMSQLLSKPNSGVDAPFTRMATGKFPAYLSQQSLLDPCNRASYSIQDLERAFQTVFATEVEQFFTINQKRTEQTVLHTIKMLDNMSTQIGKPEHQLVVGLLEEMYHSVLRLNVKEFRRVLEKNWASYQTLKNEDHENLVLFIDSEVGAIILADMAFSEYLVGNIEASERYFTSAKELTKKLSHKGTISMLLGTVAWGMMCESVTTAEKIRQLISGDLFWAPLGYLGLGRALIANGKSQEGVHAVEVAVSQLMANFGDSADICFASHLLDAYINARNITKGLQLVNNVLKKAAELNIDSYMGKAELLRQKANLLMMKKCPDVVLEVVERMAEISVEDVIALSEQQRHGSTFGPQTLPVINVFASKLGNTNSTSESANEDIEMILRSAIHLAHTKGLCIVELNCALDLVKYFLHCGDNLQAMETVQIVKDVCARMKGSPNCREFQRVQQVISLVQQQ